jgi:hypothetical protein
MIAPRAARAIWVEIVATTASISTQKPLVGDW